MKRTATLILTAFIGLALLAVALFIALRSNPPAVSEPVPAWQPDESLPGVIDTVLLAGRKYVWDIDFLPSGELLFTERSGQIYYLKDGQAQLVEPVADVKAVGEGGLMGLAIDPDFAENRFIYACFNSTAKDIRVARWRLNDLLLAAGRQDIITGITDNSGSSPGRHSGCQLAFGPDKNLWVGTGDTAQGDTSTNPRQLGGKVLRVTRDGAPVAGNMGGNYDPRIYSYGHRNIQGLAFFNQAKNGVPGLSVEHGTDKDDEVNELRQGNFGWSPPPKGYDESVPMTDKARFPDAIDAIWSSGSPTQAPSGAAMIYGYHWKGWNGAAAVAMLKARHLKILRLDTKNKVIAEEKILDGTYGRLRAVTQGPGGNLYVSTSNGNDDKIILLTPQM